MSLESLSRRAILALACCSLILGACAAYNADVPPPRELTEEEKIVARFIEAVGGEEVLRAHTSATTKGTLDIAAMGVSGEMTIFQMAPDKSLTRMIIPGFGENIEGYNGEIGWAEDPMQGARVNEGQILKDQARNARFNAELEYNDTYPEQQAAGETEWNGQAAYQLDLVDTDGNESHHYFAKDTGLLIGVETTQTSELGTADMTMSSSDYKEFGGLMVPTRTVIGVMGMEMILTVESVTWNDVDPTVFEPSDAIKALLPE